MDEEEDLIPSLIVGLVVELEMVNIGTVAGDIADDVRGDVFNEYDIGDFTLTFNWL